MKRDLNPEGSTKPAYPPGLVGRTAARMKRVVTNITIEPAMFLVAFAAQMDNIAVSQMNIYKSCRIDFNYSEEVCNNLIPNHTDVNEIVQEEVKFYTSRETSRP